MLCKLKDASPFAFLEDVPVNILIVKVYNIGMKILIVEFLYIFECWILNAVMPLENVPDRTFNHSQRSQSKNIKLNKAKRFKMAYVLTF